MRVDYIDGIIRSVSHVEGVRFDVDGGVVEAALVLVRWEFYVAEVSEAKPVNLPCWLGDIVLQLLRSFSLELAVLVESVVCGKLQPHVVKVVVCKISETMSHGFEPR